MRLEELKERMGERIRIDKKSFLLRPEPKTSDRDTFVEYTKSWLRPAAAEPRTTFVVWDSDEPQPSSSLPAQVASKAIARHFPDASGSYDQALFEAYFSFNRDISNDIVLADLAQNCGVDIDEYTAAIDEQRHDLTLAVIADHKEAHDTSVTSVPTVMVHGVLPVPGAQDVDTYERIVSRIEERRNQ